SAGAHETELTASVKSVLEPPYDLPDYVPFSSIGLSLVGVNELDDFDLAFYSLSFQPSSGAHFVTDSFAEDVSTDSVDLDLHRLLDPQAAMQSDFRECLNESDFLSDELTPDLDAIATMDTPAWIRSFPDAFTKQGSFVNNATKPWLMPATHSRA